MQNAKIKFSLMLTKYQVKLLFLLIAIINGHVAVQVRIRAQNAVLSTIITAIDIFSITADGRGV